MIQIEDWTIITALILLFVFLFVSFVAFIISKKLFPKQIEFQKDIKPKEALTVLNLEGSGRIKNIKMETTENENSAVTIIVDNTNYVTFALSKKKAEPNNISSDSRQMLDIELQLDKEFSKSFSIFINNQSSLQLNSKGKIDYEIKKSILMTLKAVLSGF